jgi:hypothetical protein
MPAGPASATSRDVLRYTDCMEDTANPSPSTWPHGGEPARGEERDATRVGGSALLWRGDEHVATSARIASSTEPPAGPDAPSSSRPTASSAEVLTSASARASLLTAGSAASTDVSECSSIRPCEARAV